MSQTPLDPTFIADLARAQEIPADGILSRTIYQDDKVNVVLFGFDTDQELSEHRAGSDAIVQVISGDLLLTLGAEEHRAGQGAWAFMPAGLSHAVRALTPAVMLLTLLGKPK